MMEINCSCFSCSQYRSSTKINFLKKSKRSGIKHKITAPCSENCDNSVSFDRLPDEVLLHIFHYISPINFDNFITLIALEMVSKRLRRCVVGNKILWENVNQLVIGFYPNLPENQYLCHIGHFTMELFLRRVQKIEKLIINLNYNWSCNNMMTLKIYPIIDRYGQKLKSRDLVILYNCQAPTTEFFLNEDAFLIKKMITNAKETLESFHFDTYLDEILSQIGPTLSKCSNLHNIKLSAEYREFNEDLETEKPD